MPIRAATAANRAGLLAITTDMIVNTTARDFDEPLPLAKRQAWLDERRRLGYPVLVAEADGQVAGYASFGDFRA